MSEIKDAEKFPQLVSPSDNIGRAVKLIAAYLKSNKVELGDMQEVAKKILQSVMVISKQIEK